MIGTVDWVITMLLGVGAAEGFLWLAATRMRREEELGLSDFLLATFFCFIGGAAVAAFFTVLMVGSDRLMPALPASIGALGAAIVVGLGLALNWRLWKKGLVRPRKEDL